MKRRIPRWCSLVALVLVLAMVAGGCGSAPKDTYALSVTADKETVSPGDTVILTAVLTKNGETIDLEADGSLAFAGDNAGEHADGNGDAVVTPGDGQTASVTLPTAGTYYIAVRYTVNQEEKAVAYAKITVAAAPEPTPESTEPPTAPDSYAVSITPDQADAIPGDSLSFTAAITRNGEEVPIEDGCALWFWADCWNDHTDGNPDAQVNADGEGKSLTATAVLPSAGTYYIAAEYKRGDEQLAIAYATVTVTDVEAPEPVDAEIFVDYVPGLDEDFMWGADVSSLLVNLNAGARYFDFDGNSLGDTVEEQGAGFMKLLQEAGYNWIRLRIWNDPYDANGKGYGGGNNDLQTAVILGKWATDAGLRVFIDFHYSDFWADPGKQQLPKAWKGLSFDELKTALGTFTEESLQTLLDAGVDVGMVQVGNETTGWMCEQDWEHTMELFKAGSAAVRKAAPDALVALHFTNPETADRYAGYAKDLDAAGVDYDVFASSYYPKDHGTIENLVSVLGQVANTYGKKVLVAETNWEWRDWPDWPEPDDAKYRYSPQGQADELTDIVKGVRSIGDSALGVFYWENAWINVAKPETAADEAQRDLIYYAGWASPYSDEYEVGVSWGSTGCGDLSLFDDTGHPLPSLKLMHYMKTGAVTERRAVKARSAGTFSCFVGEAVPALPDTITVLYNDRSAEKLPVTWTDADAVDTSTAGTYTVHGTADGFTATATIQVLYPNLLPNGDWEDEDTSMWEISNPAVAGRTWDDPYEGSCALHFWASGPVAFTARQTITLPAGKYQFTFQAQGGDMGTNPDTYGYVQAGDQTFKEDFSLTGWKVWSSPSITFELTEETEVIVGCSVTGGAGAWGTLDDFQINVVG